MHTCCVPMYAFPSSTAYTHSQPPTPLIHMHPYEVYGFRLLLFRGRKLNLREGPHPIYLTTPAAPVEYRITTKARGLLISCKGCASQPLIRRFVGMCTLMHPETNELWYLAFTKYLRCKHVFVGCQGFSVPIPDYQVEKTQALVILCISCIPCAIVNSK